VKSLRRDMLSLTHSNMSKKKKASFSFFLFSSNVDLAAYTSIEAAAFTSYILALQRVRVPITSIQYT
jgi:hypothetical protein